MIANFYSDAGSRQNAPDELVEGFSVGTWIALTTLLALVLASIPRAAAF